MVTLDGEGRLEGEWSTLVNPQRDIGAIDVHGITPADVYDAPTMGEIASEVVDLLRGRVAVAHNARFDLTFLHEELIRVGVGLPSDPIPGVCTMMSSGRFIHPASRKLADCCREAGIALTDAHSALGDARATANLMSYYLGCCAGATPWTDEDARAAAYPWPVARPAVPVACVHRRVGPRKADEWIQQMARRPLASGDACEADYAAALSTSLLDRQLSLHEQSELIALAAAAGVSKADALDVHRRYLAELARLAWADGVITDDERAEIQQVAASLGLTTAEWTQILADEAGAGSAPLSAPAGSPSAGLVLHPGDRVVFTGETKQPRDEWERSVQDAGLTIGGVTKKTAALVAADTDSESGKAKKARQYGIPVMTEAAFERAFRAYCQN